MRRLALALVALPALACGKGATGVDAGPDAGEPRFDEHALARAEDLRRTADIPPVVLTSHDAEARRRSARALARIADAGAAAALAPLLGDEDRETVAWAAYGLGYACKGREEAHVRMLAARGASLDRVRPPSRASGGAADVGVARGGAELDPYVAVARAIARCGGPLGESVLVGLLRARGPWLEPALLGLGDLATRRKQLGAEAMTATLEAASEATPATDLAFYALGRADPGDTFARRMAEVARVALARPGESRIFAVRTLGRAGKDDPRAAAADLGRVAGDAKNFTDGERAEAARALGQLGEAGHAAAATAIAALTPDTKDPIAIAELSGSHFHVLHTLLSVLPPEAPKKAEAALAVLANLTPPSQPKPGFARRLAELRCGAALALARGAHDAEVLRKCDDESSEPSEAARLASLLRRQLVRDRLAAFRALSKSEHLRTREAVIEAVGTHTELGETGALVLAEALSSKHAGLVATAAETLNAHPERALVLAESEKRAALDPRAPSPGPNPAQEIAPPLAQALKKALAESWPPDRYETRISLFEAAAAVRLPEARAAAEAACADPNPVVRERATKALRTVGAPTTACEKPPKPLTPAAELAMPLAKPTRLVLSTTGGELAIVLEPELSPVTAARLTTLAKSGFYKGIVIHRVVPGFVAQLGDPDGDGYGGSGTSLRCETSPVPFHRLDVGMALAGRDTGSSQFFVALSRTAHLDGEYTRVGRAEGDWDAIAQGDVVTDARVVE